MAFRLRGRDTEIQALRRQLDTVDTGPGSVVIVRGLPGMGKSALLAAGARLAAERGIRVLSGAGDPAAQVVPLGPLLEALVLANDPLVDPGVLRELSGSPDQRFWLLREIQEALERAALREPLLISIDDMQWADAATLSALGTLPRHLAPHPIGWLFAMRPGALTVPAREALTRLEAVDPVSITLNPLDPAAVADLAADLLGGAPDAMLRDELDGADGHPFLVTELLRGLVEENMVKVAGGSAVLTQARIPLRFVDSVGHHLARLSAEARDCTQMASLLGRRFSADELAALLDATPPAILAAVREAIAAGLLVEDGDRLAFRHDLVREAVDASLPQTLRRSLRRRAVDVMLQHGAAPADVAELVMDVAQPGDREAVGLLRRAAAEVGRVSPTIAAQLSRRALDLTPAPDPDRGPLVAEAIAYLVHAGQAAEALRLMSGSAGDLGDPAAQAEVRLSLAILSLQYAPVDATTQCRLALALPDLPVELRIQLLSILSLGLDIAGEVAAAESPAAEAAALAQASADPANRVIPLIPNAVHQFACGDWQRALDLINDAITSQHAPEWATARLWLPEGWKALILLGLARLDEAFPLIEAGMQAAQREGVSANLRIWSMIRARALLSAGRLADASAEAEAAIDMSDEMGDGTYGYINHIARYVLGRVALHTGDPAGLVQAHRVAKRLRGAVACQSTQRLGEWLTALIMDTEGDPVGAAQLGLDPLAIGPVPASSPRMYADVPVLVGILLRAGRRAEAESVVARLTDFARRHPDFPSLEAAVLHARAVLHSDADAALRAVALIAADPRPLVRAAVLEEAGRLLPAQADEAVPLLEEALAAYADCGADRDVARVHGLLRTRGVRPSYNGPRTSSRWPELTESEYAVVTLVARGATNREVAEKLYLSPHTVNSHLRHVFTRLGIRSRVELARLAAQRDAVASA
ncbi:MAG TPA: AAA family ATPase [Streptosporangiaceae bacterium]